MSELVEVAEQPSRVRDHRGARPPAEDLFWRLFAANALVFVAAATVLVLSPATVSTPVAVSEIAVLVVGLALLLVLNAVLIKASLQPLVGLPSLMQRVDLLRPGARSPVSGQGDIAQLIHTFNDMLDRLEAERATSSARTLAAQEGERQRIARELHDEIGQSLTAVLLGLKRTVDRAPIDLQDELRAIQETVRDSLEEVRQVARRLRPVVLDDLGLLSAIRALAADFSEASQIPVVRELDHRIPPLSGSAELVLYRIAQESLTNIARHAGATKVTLSVTGVRDAVVLRISDDGKGLDGAAEGAGIRGMRERALLVGADLTVDSPVAGGTQVSLVVPAQPERG